MREGSFLRRWIMGSIAAGVLAGCATPTHEPFRAANVAMIGVVDLSPYTGPMAGTGILYSLVDDWERPRRRVLLFDDAADGDLDLVGSTIYRRNGEDCVWYWRGTPECAQYAPLFERVRSYRRQELRQRYGDLVQQHGAQRRP